MTKFVTRLLKDKRGATAIEYGMLIAMIFLAIAAALSSFADTNQATWNLVATKMGQN